MLYTGSNQRFTHGEKMNIKLAGVISIRFHAGFPQKKQFSWGI